MFRFDPRDCFRIYLEVLVHMLLYFAALSNENSQRLWTVSLGVLQPWQYRTFTWCEWQHHYCDYHYWKYGDPCCPYSSNPASSKCDLSLTQAVQKAMPVVECNGKRPSVVRWCFLGINLAENVHFDYWSWCRWPSTGTDYEGEPVSPGRIRSQRESSRYSFNETILLLIPYMIMSDWSNWLICDRPSRRIVGVASNAY